MKKYISPYIIEAYILENDIICTSGGEDEGYISGGGGGGIPKEARSRQPLWETEDFNPYDD